MNLDITFLNKYDQEKNKLTSSEQKTLNDWCTFMRNKYKKVGTLKLSEISWDD